MTSTPTASKLCNDRDNASGHYQPNYQAVFQAVVIIQTGRAFHSDAVVGLVYATSSKGQTNKSSNRDMERWKNSIMFFPVVDFVHLAAAGFERRRTIQAMKQHYSNKPYPFDRLPYAAEVFINFSIFWRDTKATWEEEAKAFADAVGKGAIKGHVGKQV
jgi:hypothetical protein